MQDDEYLGHLSIRPHDSKQGSAPVNHSIVRTSSAHLIPSLPLVLISSPDPSLIPLPGQKKSSSTNCLLLKALFYKILTHPRASRIFFSWALLFYVRSSLHRRMSGFGPPKTIWELSPDELEVLKHDVTGYLDGLRATHFTFSACCSSSPSAGCPFRAPPNVCTLLRSFFLNIKSHLYYTLDMGHYHYLGSRIALCLEIQMVIR